MVKEIIVVEGKDDVVAVKRAVDAEVIYVNGFGINSKIIDKIKEAQKRCGVIVLTDPDHAGEKIRNIISKRVSGVKHAYLNQKDCKVDNDIGVENASKEIILNALMNAKFENKECTINFTIEDMYLHKLTGCNEAKSRRDELGKYLGIGYSNTNVFLRRLNNFGILKEEFLEGIKYIDEGK